jgi:pimeloyl-ACP methyl ester carboxylesterase
MATFALLLALFAVGCATPIGVDRVGAQKVRESLSRSALSGNQPSEFSRQVLHRADRYEAFRKAPRATLAELHTVLGSYHDDALLFALAELSYLHASRTGSRAHHLATVVYAWTFLLRGARSNVAGALDPRVRLAADLYNRGLAEGLASDDGEYVELRAGTYALPFGELVIELNPAGFSWGKHRVVDFVPAAELAVRGMRNRYRRVGLGAPLVASMELSEDRSGAEMRIPPDMKVSVTALLRLADDVAALQTGTVNGTLELYSEFREDTFLVAGRQVPLEYEPSSALAYSLEKSSIWDIELSGFLSGDFRLLREQTATDGLFMIQPPRPGQIPVVLVHGTASSPARWAELLNELSANPTLRERYQFWFFTYNTGNPITLSASQLRRALHNAVAELDPNGEDLALRRMVVIGHSQGGLLTKMSAIHSGSVFWNNMSERPFDELEISHETRELLQNLFFFEPVPYVQRLIFIATPHGGSFRARGRLGRFAAGLVSLPTDLTRAATDVIAQNPDAIAIRSLDDIPRSIDHMHPGHPFLETLASIPLADGVAANSIIPVLGDGPPEKGNAGVVEYRSAHVEGIPEKVVRSGHSTQSYPPTINEVERILLEHIALEDPDADSETPAAARALALVERMARYVAGLESFSFESRVEYDVLQPTGETLEFGGVRRVQVRRPDRLRVRVDDREGGPREVFFDGTSLIFHRPGEHFYGQVDLDGRLEDALDYAVERLGQPAPVSELVRSDFWSLVSGEIESATLLGESSIDGDVCHHLALRGTDVEWQVWIRRDDPPLPRRLVITYPSYDGSPRYRALFSDWDVTPELPDAIFGFDPPPGTTAVPVVGEVATERLEGAGP